MEEFKPKMRISLLSDNGAILSDRLVETQLEFYNGPKEVHTGPVRVEITLRNNVDVDNFKNYLDQLSGKLPLKPISTSQRGRPAKVKPELENPREEILQDLEKMYQEGKTQEDLIMYLRGLGFVFLLTEDFLQYFPDFPFQERDIKTPSDNGQYLNSLSWMVRRIRKAKDPKTDKYDPQLIFGISIIEGPSNKVVPYLFKERQAPLRIQASKKGLSFSTVGFTKYPVYMVEEERLKFSTEIRQVLNGKKPSKFFLRWSRDVKFPDNIKDQLQEILLNTTQNHDN